MQNRVGGKVVDGKFLHEPLLVPVEEKGKQSKWVTLQWLSVIQNYYNSITLYRHYFFHGMIEFLVS